mmetsp:Transcript_93065/g.277838  ORF Transcript_93065/g.277838 Transcript_93065/m.277838 type:complete len:228 (+) Transcript_93065:23-706(+)
MAPSPAVRPLGQSSQRLRVRPGLLRLGVPARRRHGVRRLPLLECRDARDLAGRCCEAAGDGLHPWRRVYLGLVELQPSGRLCGPSELFGGPRHPELQVERLRVPRHSGIESQVTGRERWELRAPGPAPCARVGARARRGVRRGRRRRDHLRGERRRQLRDHAPHSDCVIWLVFEGNHRQRCIRSCGENGGGGRQLHGAARTGRLPGSRMHVAAQRRGPFESSEEGAQ